MKDHPKDPKDDGTRQRDFEQRWRRWARRPPRTSPESAAHRVLTRLAEPTPQPWWRPGGGWASRDARRLVAAALAVAAAGLWLLTAGLPFPDMDPGPGPASDDSPGATFPDAPVIADGVVLMWLDAETPLYMTFAPPPQESGAEKGEGS